MKVIKQILKKTICYSWFSILLLLNFAGFYWILRFLKRKKILILAYHGVVHDKDQIDSNKSIVSYDGKHISESLFKKQIDYLKKRYVLISLSDYINYINNNKQLPDNVCILTFDDGYHNNYSTVFHFLKQKKIPATFFICVNSVATGLLTWPDSLEAMIDKTSKKDIKFPYKARERCYDLKTLRKKVEACIDIKRKLRSLNDHERNKILKIISDRLGVQLKQKSATKAQSMLSWKDVSKMAVSMDIGSHTLNHSILPKLQKKQLKRELVKSKKDIEKKIKKTVTSISYPNGIYNKKVKEFSKKAGYSAAVTIRGGYNAKKMDLFELKRVPISNFDSHLEFIFKLHFDYDSMRQSFSKQYIKIKKRLINRS